MVDQAKCDKVMKFTGKWMKIEMIVLNETTQIQEGKGYMLSFIVIPSTKKNKKNIEWPVEERLEKNLGGILMK